MNFVQHLEECLRDLAAEARKKHPGVKEASERAIVRLRTLKTLYVSHVRKANAGGVHPTTAMFQSSDLLHPFLLAANYPNASPKLLEISFRACKLLLEADAVVATDGMHMVRVWMIQGQVVQAYYQKQYAKEVMVETVLRENNGHADGAAAAAATNSGSSSSTTAKAAVAASTASSWFLGSWGATTTTSSSDTGEASATATAAAAVVSTTKNAVSSSTGQTGLSTQSPKEMEKLALEILSCLLQLLERLKKYPSALTAELWTSSVALSCLWLHCLPSKHTVRQAAHSTVSQVLSLLYQQKQTTKFTNQTWQDLLVLAVGDTTTGKKVPALHGAFSQCRMKNGAKSTSTAAAIPPSAEFALELMTQLWRRNQTDRPPPSQEQVTKSMSLTMGLLQQTTKASVEKSSRIFQWTLTVLQTQGRTYPNECRELFQCLVKPVLAATEACRSHDDFEDGFVYTRDEAVAAGVVELSGSNAGKDHTRRRTSVASFSPSSFIPVSVLWKAAMALEVIYLILEQDPKEYIIFMQEGSSMASLAEALSDFATIGASCRDHMLQLVEFCQTQVTSELDPPLSPTAKASETKPTVFRKAEQLVAAGTISSAFATDSSSSSKSAPPPIHGEALWISLMSILRIADSLQSLGDAEGLLEETFVPILAVLQHYLKRFVDSNDLVELSLLGYKSLAEVCLPLQGNALQQKALLASLCKLSLPSWGKLDALCQLQDQHAKALLCLLRIVHVHYENISSGWQTILWTLEELSVLAIASPVLSDRAYQGALAVSTIYGRLAAFSTCFSSESVIHFTEALTDISISLMENRDMLGGSDTVVPEKAVLAEVPEKTASDARGYISEKIMTIGVRAIYGSGTDEQESEDVPIAERTKNTFYEDYRRDFVQRVTASKSNLKVLSMGRIPFALTLLIDVVMANSFRYKECGDSTSVQLARLAASSSAVRAFGMDAMAMLTMHHISKEASFPSPSVGPARVLYSDPKQNQLWATEPKQESIGTDNATSISHAELISPLCKSIRTTEKAVIAEAALGALNSVLEGAGHNLEGDAWSILIDAVSSLSGNPSYEIDRSSSAWSKCCLMAFGCLKLIVNDFLDQLPGETGIDTSTSAQSSLLDCCSSFGSSLHDVNTSLTAIGLLWTIADQDSSADAVDRALSKLVLLSSDDRAEVRNCSVNTLFSCVVGRGGEFSPAQWEFCISETIFGVYDLVTNKTRSNEGEATPSRTKVSRYTVALHHSRDSTGKQWVATQVLVLQGLMRVLRNFFSQLLGTVDSVVIGNAKNSDDAPWFQDAWVRILDFAFEAAGQGGGRDALDIRSVGVELLTVACQLTSKAGIHAATTPARVGTHMEVVNGALRSVRETHASKIPKDLKQSHSMATELSRQNLFLEAFESLESFLELLDLETIGSAADDTRLQVLHRFASGLSKLYECCKDAEFSVDNAKRCLKSLKNEELQKDQHEDLEARFVKIVATITGMAGDDPKSRFLNQAQRASLDLLKSMASDGSSEAFKDLISLAGMTFFVRKDSDADANHSHPSEADEIETYPLISFEAAMVVSEEVSKEGVSDECKVFVLANVFAVFSKRDSDTSTGRILPRRKRLYKLIVPIIIEGLRGTSQMENCVGSPASSVWALFCRGLSELLTPAPVAHGLLKIPRVGELCQIVSVALESAHRSYVANICQIVSYGAAKAMEVAILDDTFARANAESDMGRKCKKHRIEALKLFTTCFKGCCALSSEDPALRSIAQEALSSAIEVTAETREEPSEVDVRVETALIVCQTMQKQKLEALVIFTFPLLCKLVTCKEASLRDAVSEVFTTVDVTAILQSAHSRYADAEWRAKQAEEREQELSAEVDELKRKIAALERS